MPRGAARGLPSRSPSTASGSPLPTRPASSDRSRADAARGGRGERRAARGRGPRRGARARSSRRPATRRAAVAMSGGVDSAVALLRAAPDAIGVTLGSGRTRPRPTRSVRAAPRRRSRPRAPPVMRSASRTSRSTCARSSASGRRSVRARLRRPATRRTRACAATAPSASTRCSRSPSARGRRELWTGHYARIVERDGVLLVAARPTRGRTSPTCSRRSTRAPRARALPARRADEGGDARRGRGCRARGGGTRARARRRASSAATTTARSSSGRACGRATGAIVDADGARSGPHGGYWRFTPGQRRGLGVNGRRPLYVLRTDARDEPVVVGRPRRARDDEDRGARPPLRASQRAEAKLRYRSPPVRRSTQTTAASRSSWRSPRTASHRPGRGALRRRRRCGRRCHHGRRLDRSI